MRIIFIGNYSLDKQESMQRFSELLYTGFRNAGYDCEIWRPTTVIGSLTKNTMSGIPKWLGYIDKWILFPAILRWRLLSKKFRGPDTRFHICDHSNAPYLKHLPKDRTAITCHDVLAIRGALGYKDAYCTATFAGKLLQKWILNSLNHATLMGVTSQLTLSQLENLSTHKMGKKDWRIIHLGFNAEFKPLEPKERNVLLSRTELKPEIPYILHVGSDQPRKNRKLLVDMAHALGDRWNGIICYAGQAADEKILAHAESLGLRDRIVSVINPNHNTLLALYSGCEAFVWPSFSEGFGWPLIEAQACGAPVLASNIAPMPEVSNGTALHADPTSAKDFAEAFLTLKDESVRRDLIRRGFENCLRFKPVKMINSYLALHGLKSNKS